MGNIFDVIEKQGSLLAYRRGKSPRMNKRTVLLIWKSGDRSEDKSRTSDFRIETSPMSPVTIKTLVAVKKKNLYQHISNMFVTCLHEFRIYEFMNFFTKFSLFSFKTG